MHISVVLTLKILISSVFKVCIKDYLQIRDERVKNGKIRTVGIIAPNVTQKSSIDEIAISVIFDFAAKMINRSKTIIYENTYINVKM